MTRSFLQFSQSSLLTVFSMENTSFFKIRSRLYDWFGLVWFGLVLLINGIRIFVGYLISNPSLLKKNSDTI